MMVAVLVLAALLAATTVAWMSTTVEDNLSGGEHVLETGSLGSPTPRDPRSGSAPESEPRTRIVLPHLVNTLLDTIRPRFDRLTFVVRIAPDLEPAMGKAQQLRDELLNGLTELAEAAEDGATVRVALANDTAGSHGTPDGRPNGHFVVLEATAVNASADGSGADRYLKLMTAATRTTGVHRIVAPARDPEPDDFRSWPRGRYERVLVVDDELAVRDVCRRILERLDYEVAVASNAREARAMIADQGWPALLLTDIIMPGGSGTDLAAELIEQRPELRVLVTSGLGPSDSGRSGATPYPFLQKPYEAGELARAVRRLLDPPSAASRGGTGEIRPTVRS